MRLGFLLAALLLAAPVEAQWPGPAGEPTDQDLAEARELYQAGTEQVQAHRWADALDSFERSYRLSGASVALYSLAYTLRVLGRYREARDSFSQLLAEHTDLEPAIRRDAEALRREVSARIAVLRLAGLPAEPAPSVMLDGVSVDDGGERPLPVETDPGERTIQVAASGYEPFLWHGTVVPGEDRTLDVVLEESAGAGGEEGGVTSHPVFWVAVGVGVVAAAVIVGVLLYDGAQLDQRTDHGFRL